MQYKTEQVVLKEKFIGHDAKDLGLAAVTGRYLHSSFRRCKFGLLYMLSQSIFVADFAPAVNAGFFVSAIFSACFKCFAHICTTRGDSRSIRFAIIFFLRGAVLQYID